MSNVDRQPIWTELAETYSTSGDHTVVAAPGDRKRLYLKAITIQPYGANEQVVYVKSAASSTVWGPLTLAADTIITINDIAWTPNSALIVNNSAAEAISISGLYGTEDL